MFASVTAARKAAKQLRAQVAALRKDRKAEIAKIGAACSANRAEVGAAVKRLRGAASALVKARRGELEAQRRAACDGTAKSKRSKAAAEKTAAEALEAAESAAKALEETASKGPGRVVAVESALVEAGLPALIPIWRELHQEIPPGSIDDAIAALVLYAQADPRDVARAVEESGESLAEILESLPPALPSEELASEADYWTSEARKALQKYRPRVLSGSKPAWIFLDKDGKEWGRATRYVQENVEQAILKFAEVPREFWAEAIRENTTEPQVKARKDATGATVYDVTIGDRSFEIYKAAGSSGYDGWMLAGVEGTTFGHLGETKAEALETLGRMARYPEAAPDWFSKLLSAPPPPPPAPAPPPPPPAPAPPPPSPLLAPGPKVAEVETPTLRQIGIVVSPSEIPLEAAMAAWRHSSWTPDVRAAQEQQAFMRGVEIMAAKLLALTKDPVRTLRAIEAFIPGYKERFLALLAARARVASSAVVGPSGFDHASNQKRIETERKRLEELIAYQDRFYRQHIPSRGVSADDADAIEKLQGRLEALKQQYANLDEIRQVANSKTLSEEDKQRRLVELGIEASQARRAAQSGWKSISYTRQNLSQERKRIEERIQRLQQEQARGVVEVETEVDGIPLRILDSPEKNRIQLFFADRVSSDWASRLKARGFRWAPSEKAWQRQRTDNARRTVEQMFGVKMGTARAGTMPSPAQVEAAETAVESALEAGELEHSRLHAAADTAASHEATDAAIERLEAAGKIEKIEEGGELVYRQAEGFTPAARKGETGLLFEGIAGASLPYVLTLIGVPVRFQDDALRGYQEAPDLIDAAAGVIPVPIGSEAARYFDAAEGVDEDEAAQRGMVLIQVGQSISDTEEKEAQELTEDAIEYADSSEDLAHGHEPYREFAAVAGPNSPTDGRQTEALARGTIRAVKVLGLAKVKELARKGIFFSIYDDTPFAPTLQWDRLVQDEDRFKAAAYGLFPVNMENPYEQEEPKAPESLPPPPPPPPPPAPPPPPPAPPPVESSWKLGLSEAEYEALAYQGGIAEARSGRAPRRWDAVREELRIPTGPHYRAAEAAYEQGIREARFQPATEAPPPAKGPAQPWSVLRSASWRQPRARVVWRALRHASSRGDATLFGPELNRQVLAAAVGGEGGTAVVAGFLKDLIDAGWIRQVRHDASREQRFFGGDYRRSAGGGAAPGVTYPEAEYVYELQRSPELWAFMKGDFFFRYPDEALRRQPTMEEIKQAMSGPFPVFNMEIEPSLKVILRSTYSYQQKASDIHRIMVELDMNTLIQPSSDLRHANRAISEEFFRAELREAGGLVEAEWVPIGSEAARKLYAETGMRIAPLSYDGKIAFWARSETVSDPTVAFLDSDLILEQQRAVDPSRFGGNKHEGIHVSIRQEFHKAKRRESRSIGFGIFNEGPGKAPDPIKFLQALGQMSEPRKKEVNGLVWRHDRRGAANTIRAFCAAASEHLLSYSQGELYSTEGANIQRREVRVLDRFGMFLVGRTSAGETVLACVSSGQIIAAQPPEKDTPTTLARSPEEVASAFSLMARFYYEQLGSLTYRTPVAETADLVDLVPAFVLREDPSAIGLKALFLARQPVVADGEVRGLLFNGINSETEWNGGGLRLKAHVVRDGEQLVIMAQASLKDGEAWSRKIDFSFKTTAPYYPFLALQRLAQDFPREIERRSIEGLQKLAFAEERTGIETLFSGLVIGLLNEHETDPKRIWQHQHGDWILASEPIFKARKWAVNQKNGFTSLDSGLLAYNLTPENLKGTRKDTAYRLLARVLDYLFTSGGDFAHETIYSGTEIAAVMKEKIITQGGFPNMSLSNALEWAKKYQSQIPAGWGKKRTKNPDDGGAAGSLQARCKATREEIKALEMDQRALVARLLEVLRYDLASQKIASCEAPKAEVRARYDREIAKLQAKIREAEQAARDLAARGKVREREALPALTKAASDALIESTLGAIEPRLLPLWRQLGGSIEGRSAGARLEVFLTFVREHPEEASAAQKEDPDMAHLPPVHLPAPLPPKAPRKPRTHRTENPSGRGVDETAVFERETQAIVDWANRELPYLGRSRTLTRTAIFAPDRRSVSEYFDRVRRRFSGSYPKDPRRVAAEMFLQAVALDFAIQRDSYGELSYGVNMDHWIRKAREITGRTENPSTTGAQVWTEDGKTKVRAPFSLDFQRRALELGGRWNSRDHFWFFPEKEARRVQAVVNETYRSENPCGCDHEQKALW